MRFIRRLRDLFSRSKLDAEMAEEMQAHVDLQTERNLKAGMPPDEARYAAQRQFGNVASIQEQAREQRGWVWLENLGRDVFHAARMLEKNRGFTAAAVVSLALCIGANSAVFSMLYALVIRPLPFRDSSQIVEIYNSFPKVGTPKLASNVAQYLDFKQNTSTFSQVGLWQLDDYTLADATGPTRISGVRATADMFALLGVQPLLGRFFTTENHAPGADTVVVLTHSFWISHFQSDPGVVGRTLRLDGQSFEIIGVTSDDFEAFNAQAKLVRPLSWSPKEKLSRLGYSSQLYARLKPTATLTGAFAQAVALEKQFYDSAPPQTRDFLDRTGHVIRVERAQSLRAEPIQNSLYLLQGGVLVVLLIGCVNVANLSLARFNARQGEFAIRAALGAGQGTIMRQLFVESALLACLGAVGGLLLAESALSAMNRFTAGFQPDALPFRLERLVFVYTGGTTVALALFIGLLPMLRVLGSDFSCLVKGQGRGASPGRAARVASGTLVIGQIAFAFVLLMSAGLLIRSFSNILAVNPGFDPRQVLSARIAIPADKEKSFPPRIEAALQEIPGIEVGLATATPFVLVPHYQVSMPLEAVGLRDYQLPAGAPVPSVYCSGASLSYLKTMHIPLRQGRWFGESDREHNRSVVVDDNFASRYFPGRSAVGQHLVLNRAAPDKEEDWLEIIGVVGDVRYNGIEDRSGLPFVYVPLPHMPFYGTMSVFIRTERSVSEVMALLREKVAAIDPTLPIVQVAPMTSVIDESYGNRRSIVQLLISFAGIALLLSGVGIYGVLAYDVSRRTREIGIRGAIGATRWQLSSLILAHGIRKTVIGLLIGLIGAMLLSNFLTSLLFEVKPTDPTVYATVSLLLMTVAIFASWLPARRAARVDPVIALRAE
jgi:predicted permease